MVPFPIPEQHSKGGVRRWRDVPSPPSLMLGPKRVGRRVCVCVEEGGADAT